jgi:hypothetical protein
MAPPVLKHTIEIEAFKGMAKEPNHVNSHRVARLAEKMHDKEYRDGYVVAHNRQVLAKQMREFRGDKPQTEFADLIGKKQTVVSRLENPSYSGWTLGTLFEIASKLNVAVFVRFVDFQTFLKYSGAQSESALCPAPYDPLQLDDFAQAESLRELERIRKILEPKPRPPERSKKQQYLAAWDDDNNRAATYRPEPRPEIEVPKLNRPDNSAAFHGPAPELAETRM